MTLWEKARLKTQKGSWVPKDIHALFLSTRPWSFPSSIFPCILTFLNARNEFGAELSLQFLVASIVVILLHVLANVVNTMKDFENGVDDKKAAADRTFVDDTVTVGSFKTMTCILGALGLLSCVLLQSWVCYLAFALSICYTAGPALKYIALGDVVIFIVFGPSIGYFITSALTPVGVDYTYPLFHPLALMTGIQTMAILHANNTRDLKHDKEKGVITLANIIGLEPAKYYYTFINAISYIVAFYAYGFQAWPVLACLPNTRYILSRFWGEDFQYLDERTAQHNLLFQSLLAAVLLEFRLLAKVSIAAIYVLGAIHNIICFEYSTFLVKESMIRSIGVELPHIVYPVSLAFTICVQLICSVLFVFNINEKLGAFGMIVILLPVTVSVHDFWGYETDVNLYETEKNAHAPRTVPSFITSFDNHFVHFFKNLSIIGGLALFLSCDDLATQ